MVFHPPRPHLHTRTLCLPWLRHGQLQLTGRHLEEDGGCSQIPGSKVIPVLLAKGERSRARVSGAEISFKRLTPEGQPEPVWRSEAPSLGMMYRFGPTEERDAYVHTPSLTGADAQSFRACRFGISSLIGWDKNLCWNWEVAAAINNKEERKQGYR